MLIPSFDLFLRINCGFMFLLACCFTSFSPQLLLMLEGLVDERSRLNEALQAERQLYSSLVKFHAHPERWESDCIFYFYSSLCEDAYSLQCGKKKKVDHYWSPVCHSFYGFLWASASKLSQEYFLFHVVIAKIKWEYMSGVSVSTLHVVRTCIFLSFVCSLSY